MAKRALRIAFRIPPYASGRRLQWRRDIHAAAVHACRRAGVSYEAADRLEVRVRLYMDADLLSIHDVDNRAKDVLDALQGRAGGSKRLRALSAVIPNDSQVHRLVIEKTPPPKQARGLGHVLVRRVSGRAV